MRSTFLLLLTGLGLSQGACARAEPPPNVAEASSAFRVPAPQDFMFGPGDTLEIKVWRAPEMDAQVTVAPDGTLSLPLVGRLYVSGMTWTELVENLEARLAEYYVNPSVSVNLLEVSSQKVLVLGEVRSPAVLQIESELTILEALVRTGGIHPDARTDNVLLVRGGLDTPELVLVNVDAIYGRGDFSQLVLLQRGDIVVVPARTIVDVERFFRRIQGMLAPFVAGSAVYRNAVSGGAQGTSFILND